MVDKIGPHKLVPVSRSKAVNAERKKPPPKKQSPDPAPPAGADKGGERRGGNVDEFC